MQRDASHFFAPFLEWQSLVFFSSYNLCGERKIVLCPIAFGGKVEDAHAHGRCLIEILTLADGSMVKIVGGLRHQQILYLFAYGRVRLLGQQIVASDAPVVGSYDLGELACASDAVLVCYGHDELARRHDDVDQYGAGSRS